MRRSDQARGDIQGVRRSIHRGRAGRPAEWDWPETRIDDGIATGIRQRPKKFSSHRIEYIDLAITEIPDHDVVGELTEVRRCKPDAPRRIQMPALSEVAQQIPVGVKHADITMPRL